MATKKLKAEEVIHKVKISRMIARGSGNETPKFVEGNLDYLRNYFSYTFEIGRSWNSKIKYPSDCKTIKVFLNHLQKSYEEKEAQCYNRTSVELVTE